MNFHSGLSSSKISRCETLKTSKIYPENTLVKCSPREPFSQATLMSLKANTTDALAILSYANQNILQTRKDYIMPSLSKEFRQLRNNVPKDSKLLFGDDINQRIMSISK